MQKKYLTREEKVRFLLENGYYDCTLDAEGNEYHSRKWFYSGYEEMTFYCQVQPVPLHYNPATQRIVYLPRFMGAADKGEFEKWRQRFLHGLDWTEENLFPEEDLDESMYPGADLPYRDNNYEYATYMVGHMLGALPLMIEEGMIKSDFTPDNYGWIEARRDVFYSLLLEISDRQKMPRLPVRFDTPDKIPVFRAGDEEVVLYFATIKQRAEETVKEDGPAFDERDRLLEKGEDLNLSFEDIVEESREANKILLATLDTNKHMRHKRWEEENKNLIFPSAIDAYPHETAQNFFDTQEELIVPNSYTQQDFIETKKVDPGSDLNLN